ncbi:hypothetical protein SNEBB_002126 [Seison nebaliae]|nr:hypothetical protein SNEBB_002126 [Seison nebaliae]
MVKNKKEKNHFETDEFFRQELNENDSLFDLYDQFKRTKKNRDDDKKRKEEKKQIERMKKKELKMKEKEKEEKKKKEKMRKMKEDEKIKKLLREKEDKELKRFQKEKEDKLLKRFQKEKERKRKERKMKEEEKSRQLEIEEKSRKKGLSLKDKTIEDDDMISNYYFNDVVSSSNNSSVNIRTITSSMILNRTPVMTEKKSVRESIKTVRESSKTVPVSNDMKEKDKNVEWKMPDTNCVRNNNKINSILSNDTITNSKLLIQQNNNPDPMIQNKSQNFGNSNNSAKSVKSRGSKSSSKKKKVAVHYLGLTVVCAICNPFFGLLAVILNLWAYNANCIDRPDKAIKYSQWAFITGLIGIVLSVIFALFTIIILLNSDLYVQ